MASAIFWRNRQQLCNLERVRPAQSSRCSLRTIRKIHVTRFLRHTHGLDPIMRRRRTLNGAITSVCISTGIAVYASWNYAGGGLVYNMWDVLRKRKDGWVRSLGIELPSRRTVERNLHSYFTLSLDNSKDYRAWIGSAFSHKEGWHALFNLATWASVAPLLYGLPPIHMAVLISGSLVASGAAFLASQKGKPIRERSSGLGSSGILSGILSASVMFFPLQPMVVFFIVPVPLFAAVGGYFLVDAYFEHNDIASRTAHSAQLGGSVFGVAYYLLFLRRYGGILGR